MSAISFQGDQLLALETPLPALVLAGAGTGKTTVLTHRIANLIRNGIPPDAILALTFTDKAASEMGERLGALIGVEEAQGVMTRTFHSFGAEIVTQHALRLGLAPEPTVLGSVGGWLLLADILDDLTFDYVELPTDASLALHRLLGFFSTAKDHLVTPDMLESWARRPISLPDGPARDFLLRRQGEMADLARAYHAYDQALRAANAVEFGDLIALPVRLFASDAALVQQFRQRFQYIFVDEYQDTNAAQRELLLHVLDPVRASIFVIGDDDQAIYTWRGAVVQNILQFPRERVFLAHQVAQPALVTNRRSVEPILRLANRVLSLIPPERRHGKTLRALDTDATAIVGRFVADTDTAEAEWIARQIRERHAAGVVDPKGPNGKRGYGCFAVLCRKKRLFPAIAEALDRAGIPYEVIGGAGFYGRSEIRDLLSYLRLVADPGDNLALARVALSDRWKIAERDLAHLGRWAGRDARRRRDADGELAPVARLWQAIENLDEIAGLSDEARRRLTALHAEIRRFREQSRHLPLGSLVALVIEETGYLREYGALGDFEARLAVLNIRKLLELATEFRDVRGAGGLAAFVEYVGYAVEHGDDESEVRPVDEGSDAVKVMSVHQAKGLEFPVVFVPGLAARIFPSERRDDPLAWDQLPDDLRADREGRPCLDFSDVTTDRELEERQKEYKKALGERDRDEEVRLFYVAITRAQRELYLSRAHYYGTNKRAQAPSDFWELLVAGDEAADLGGSAEAPAANPNVQLSAGAHLEMPTSLEQYLAEGPAALDAVIRELADEDPLGYASAIADAEHLLARAATIQADPQPPAPLSVSVSRMMDFFVCPRRHRYVYVDGLPEKPSGAAKVGQRLHEAIARRASLPDPEDGASADTTEAVAETWTESTSAAVLFPDLLRAYESSVYGRREPWLVEQSFYLQLGPHTVIGRWDRIDREGDRYVIVDFKSGRHSTGNERMYRLQLHLYALAARASLALPPTQIAARLFFLRDRHEIEVPIDASVLDSARAEALALLERMAAGDDAMTEDVRVCTTCPYNHLCNRQ